MAGRGRAALIGLDPRDDDIRATQTTYPPLSGSNRRSEWEAIFSYDRLVRKYERAEIITKRQPLNYRILTQDTTLVLDATLPQETIPGGRNSTTKKKARFYHRGT